MSGLNAMSSASKGNSFVYNNNNVVKPPAPWRSRAEFERLVKKGRCVRCGKPGHWGRNCPTYSSAIRPNIVDAICVGEDDCTASESGKEDP